MKILTIGGSNSKNSINKAFAYYTASLFSNSEIEKLDINNFELPIYSIDLETSTGIHANAISFANKIDEADFIILSLAENNGSYNVGFKNLIDWSSRIKGRKLWGNKPMLLLATSPGARGGATVLEGAANYFPFMGAIIKDKFSLPNFNQNFDLEKGIINEEILKKLSSIIKNIESNI